MKSTHRRNEDLMQQAVLEAQTSIERVKVSLNCMRTQVQTLCISNGADMYVGVSALCVISGPCVWPRWGERVLHVSECCVCFEKTYSHSQEPIKQAGDLLQSVTLSYVTSGIGKT